MKSSAPKWFSNKAFIICLVLFSFQENFCQSNPVNVNQISGSSSEQSSLIACDDLGNTYVYSTFTGSVTQIHNQNLVQSKGDGFLACYNGNGQFQWLKQIDRFGVSQLKANNQFVYLCGNFKDSASVGTTKWYGTQSYDGAIIKATSQGTSNLLLKIRGPGNQSIRSMDVDGSGNIYAFGEHDFESYINNDTLKIKSLATSNSFLIKTDTSGNLLWSNTITNIGSKMISVSHDGSKLFALAHAYGQVAADSIHFSAGNNFIQTPGPYNHILFSFGSNCQFKAHYSMPHGNHYYIEGIDQDSTGNLYLADCSYYSGYGIQRFDTLLNPLWSKFIPFDSGGSWLYDMKVDKAGNSYTAGGFYKKISFPGDTVTNNELGNTSFIAKYDPYGNYSWVESSITSKNNTTAIDLNNNGELFFTGYFNDTLTWSNSTFYCVGQTDYYIGKISTQIPLNITKKTLNKAMIAYPNPSKGLFIVKNIINDATVEVFNSLGEPVQATISINEVQTIINLERMPEGIYFLKISSTIETFTNKIILQK